VALAQTWPLQLDAMGAVYDAVEDGIANRRIAEPMEMPQPLIGESLRSGWLTRIIPCMANAFRSAIDGLDGERH
jgi:hypothetical protein